MLQLPAGREASQEGGAVEYERHRPERTLLYQLVEEYYPAFKVQWAAEGKELPDYVQREFEDYLKCGCLEHGFYRVRCESCHEERLLGFSCKKRGFCPSCGARRMAQGAALLVDDVFPCQPVRQWVLSFPAGTAVPVYYKAGRIGETPVTDRPRQSALRAEDTVSRWHHPCDL